MAICSKLKRIGFVEAVVTMTIYLKRKRKRIICVANGQTNLLMKKNGINGEDHSRLNGEDQSSNEKKWD